MIWDLNKYDAGALNAKQQTVYRWLKQSVGHGVPAEQMGPDTSHRPRGGSVGTEYTPIASGAGCAIKVSTMRS